MTDHPTIFKATYSGVAVYELMCKNIAVMRRRDDGYVNATQILKVAEFGKPQRTRILEREVQTGTHEKIQGGYGKYQGTWIPIERGKELARRYDVFELLSPLLMFQEGTQSPPLAPKHATATTYKPRMPREPKLTKKQKQLLETNKDKESTWHAGMSNASRARAYAGYKQPPPSGPSNYHQNRNSTMSPVEEDEEMLEDDDDDDNVDMDEMEDELYESEEPYDVQLLRHFISGDPRVPSLLIHPPSDLDFNIIIDDEGHTSLHWAAAMGHLKIVKLLLHHGADVSRVNYKGQTALIRSVLFTNNFERRCFLHMLDLLRKTIFNIDKKDQTVFHHIASTAGWKGKVHASRYYMECLMEKIRSRREDLVQILNVQDVYGDTALTIASRIGNKKLVRLLVEAGANPQLANEEGKTSQDYIMEYYGRHASNAYQQPITDENIRKRARKRVDDVLKTNMDDTDDSYLSSSNDNTKKQRLSPSSSPVIRDVAKVVDEFISSFERDQEHKDQVLREATIELQMVRKRLDMTNKTIHQLAYDENAMTTVEKEASLLQDQVHKVLEYTQMIQLQRLVQQRLSSSRSSSIESSSFLSTSVSSSSINNRTSSARTSTLHSILPTSKTTDQSENSNNNNNDDNPQALEQQWSTLIQQRTQLVKDIVQLQAQMPNKKYQDYKRLISMCCNVNYENVDLMLSPLLASFEQQSTQTPM
ncbi:uncharacterized protein BX664DRAFT_362325 [Halteromyces radiatus]|uniref:uncharacterized protein n=1 Tax=Halteromyces radiatus TaxID=101107 RepID=UPI00221F169A|nr:uncharacterized protein BX664DRAFT_362325 [Halteromyces radiatus]KAI8078758.1 hypothetical protein BX664DRAFT_362325 [Halteromyces radiatus]